MARAILRHEINERPDNSIRIMRNALQMARGQECIKIKANPVDGETARNLLHEEIQDTDAVDKVEVVADKSIDPGGCLIETDFGNIDARIEQQLNSAASQLKSQIMTESKMEVEGTYNIPKFDHFHHTISGLHPINACGHVTKVLGLVVEANGP
jgi:flagellar biosynthesis/type III secretory pathway protein FliH